MTGIIIGYLLGSVPFGLILTRLAGLGDIRKVGSGNIGATNVLRAGGLKLALITTILDMSKAAIAFYLFGIWAGVAAVIGHNFPVWLKFKGGKGVASSGGLALAISPVLFFTCLAVWLIVAIAFGYSSLAALVAMIVAVVLAFAISANIGLAVLFLVILGFWRHRENIKRLIGGTESKIKLKKK